MILLLIVVWATFVASLAPFVGAWPVLVQAPFYLVMGMVWIIPLKPLVTVDPDRIVPRGAISSQR